MIDAHQHFWTLARGDYGWLTPDLSVLYRDFGPQDLAPFLEASRITHSVVVQAAPTVAETRHLIELAEQNDRIVGVVGWVDLADADVEATLDELASHPRLRGVRPMLQDIADDDWMLGPEVHHGLRALADRGLCFDALVKPRHLPQLLVLIERHPDLRVVIDHAAKPDIAGGRLGEWARDLARIACETAACCKLSGLVTEARADWQLDDLRPVVERLFDGFGASRVMWGSDWPVVDLAGGFTRWRETSLALLEGLDADAQSEILGGTAERFYGLTLDRSTAQAASLDPERKC